MIGDFSSETKTKDWVDISPRTFIVFDLEGNHIKTIKTKGGFSNWITDDDNERLIIYFNDRKHLLVSYS
jgi:sugar lactone lactonase YvrE